MDSATTISNSKTMTTNDSSIINHITDLLNESPIDLEITVLTTSAGEEDDDEEESISTPFHLKESIVLVEQHLGIDFNCLGYITNKIKKQYYRNRKQHSSHLFDITSCLLLINPDHTTCYNDRRRCLLKMITEKQRQSQQQQQQEEDPLIITLVQEIQYMNLLMTQHTKAPSSWSHRKFVVKRLIHYLVARLTSNEDDASSVKQTSSEIQMYTKKLQHFIQQELTACSSVATKYPKNYYAWTHRMWMIQLLREGLDNKNNVSDNGTTVSSLLSLLFKSIVTSEIHTMWKEWIPQHPTDHSAVHYTTQLLKLQLQPSCREDPQQQQEAIKVAKESFAFINQLLEKPNDMVTSNANEVIWILRRNVCSVLWNSNGEGGNDDHDTATIVQKLVVDDIQSVVDGLRKQQRDARANDVTAAMATAASAATNNIHALTFVAWCITNLDTIPIKDDDDDDNENDNIDRQRSAASLIMTSQTKHVLQHALQHHPGIAHQMWNKRAVVL
jgi:protein prenyltransferase alpha subunit repeat containing protein 1